MKKIKLLTPILSIAALGSCIAPIATSCSQTVEETNIIPTDLLDIVGYTLKGFKEDADISKYDTLVIPEGVKYIYADAFKDVFKMGTTNGCIKWVQFPNTLREIRDNAFYGCDSLRVLDFTGWNHDHIHYLTVGSKAFTGTSKVGIVSTDDTITEESKDKLFGLLSSGELDDCWFAPMSEDKISADEAWKVQKKENGKKANYLFTCNVDLKGASLYAQVSRTGGTKGVDVQCSKDVLGVKLTPKEGNVYELPVSLINHEKTDDYAEFVVGFVAIDDATSGAFKPLWQQVISGFKLINIKTDTPEPEIEDMDLLDQTFVPSYEQSSIVDEKDANEFKDIFLEKLGNDKTIFAQELRYCIMNSLKDTISESEGIEGIDGNEPKAKLSVYDFSSNSDGTLNFKIEYNLHYILNYSVEINDVIKETYDFDLTLEFKNLDYYSTFYYRRDEDRNIVPEHQLIPSWPSMSSKQNSTNPYIYINMEGKFGYGVYTYVYPKGYYAKYEDSTKGWEYTTEGLEENPMIFFMNAYYITYNMTNLKGTYYTKNIPMAKAFECKDKQVTGTAGGSVTLKFDRKYAKTLENESFSILIRIENGPEISSGISLTSGEYVYTLSLDDIEKGTHNVEIWTTIFDENKQTNIACALEEITLIVQ